MILGELNLTWPAGPKGERFLLYQLGRSSKEKAREHLWAGSCYLCFEKCNVWLGKAVDIHAQIFRMEVGPINFFKDPNIYVITVSTFCKSTFSAQSKFCPYSNHAMQTLSRVNALQFCGELGINAQWRSPLASSSTDRQMLFFLPFRHTLYMYGVAEASLPRPTTARVIFIFSRLST